MVALPGVASGWLPLDVSVWRDAVVVSGVVDVVVVSGAQECAVGEVGGTTFCVGGEVVCFAPAWWSVAPGEGAASVSLGEVLSLVSGEVAFRSPVVEG